jgi:hypothetical protein
MLQVVTSVTAQALKMAKNGIISLHRCYKDVTALLQHCYKCYESFKRKENFTDKKFKEQICYKCYWIHMRYVGVT